MYDMIFENYKSYDFWLKYSKFYSIVHVLEFCGSDRFVREAALALPMFDSNRPPYDDLDKTEKFFIRNFKNLPDQYRNAITRNVHLGTDFFLKIIHDIDWNIFVENYGVSIQVFQDYFHKFNIYVCANSNIRQDVFGMFDRAEILKKLNIVQKLRSPRFEDSKELFPLGPLCKTDEEKSIYVDRIVLKIRQPKTPTWLPGNKGQFWYNYFIYNPRLCAVFCDYRDFLEVNISKFDWDFVCLNPMVDSCYLKKRLTDVNRDNLLKSHTADDLVAMFEDSYNKNDIYKWYISIKFPPKETEFVQRYFGNRSIFDPALLKKPTKPAFKSSAPEFTQAAAPESTSKPIPEPLQAVVPEPAPEPAPEPLQAAAPESALDAIKNELSQEPQPEVHAELDDAFF